MKTLFVTPAGVLRWGLLLSVALGLLAWGINPLAGAWVGFVCGCSTLAAWGLALMAFALRDVFQR
ncbi:hypothetical protein EBQ26_10565 [Allofranklinella schreckenbergeri]|uniref:Uncharacterized protein n=1 Tax=Allofranklinella schreckenbergeri TaxID=1076744 RepID=A0A3M6Q0N9_9BURK|nr:hypothetical protein [Allofranklinella schreckenbergeri]RMW96040.1 hypothetical protein EBQ26_10565 [Allofranklinella schreckenbergeri]